MARQKDPEWLSASELGDYAYCAKKFELQLRGTPIGKGDQQRLSAGTRGHNRHGRTVDWQLRIRRAGLRLALVALALAGALFFLSRGGT